MEIQKNKDGEEDKKEDENKEIEKEIKEEQDGKTGVFSQRTAAYHPTFQLDILYTRIT